jgi:hypothetical protein
MKMKMDWKTVGAIVVLLVVCQQMTNKKEKESMCGMCGV